MKGPVDFWRNFTEQVMSFFSATIECCPHLTKQPRAETVGSRPELVDQTVAVSQIATKGFPIPAGFESRITGYSEDLVGTDAASHIVVLDRCASQFELPQFRQESGPVSSTADGGMAHFLRRDLGYGNGLIDKFGTAADRLCARLLRQ